MCFRQISSDFFVTLQNVDSESKEPLPQIRAVVEKGMCGIAGRRAIRRHCLFIDERGIYQLVSHVSNLNKDDSCLALLLEPVGSAYLRDDEMVAFFRLE